MTLPGDQDGAINTTASTARNGQYHAAQRGSRASPPGGRHSAASASRIGYSAIHEKAKRSWLYHGRAVKVIDGSTVTMPDTPENQAAYPRQASQAPGLGFPIARILVIFSLAVGTVLEAAIGPYQGKQTSELALLRQVLDQFQPDGPVAGHHVVVVERVYERSVNAGERSCFKRLPPLIARDPQDPPAHPLDRAGLGFGSVFRRDHRG
jgi:hypothetical protein